jgi:flagellar basal body-associated protein FliL
MADNKGNAKGNDSEDTKEAKPSESKPAKGKGGMMMPLIIGAIVLGLGGLGVGGYMLMSNMQAAKAAPAEGGATETAIPENTNIYLEKPIEGIVNLAPSTQSPFTYLKYAFVVEVDAEPTVVKIDEMLPRLTAEVAGVMSGRVWEEISGEEGRKQLADVAKAAINTSLSEEGQVIGVYFTTFVAQ